LSGSYCAAYAGLGLVLKPRFIMVYVGYASTSVVSIGSVPISLCVGDFDRWRGGVCIPTSRAARLMFGWTYFVSYSCMTSVVTIRLSFSS
jgi:hypothetical protein